MMNQDHYPWCEFEFTTRRLQQHLSGASELMQHFWIPKVTPGKAKHAVTLAADVQGVSSVCHAALQWPLFTKEVNSRLAKCPLVFNDHLANHGLTHWGRVTHICVGKLIIIGSDNGLSPDRRQAIIWPNARLLSIGPLRTYFNENLIKIQHILFHGIAKMTEILFSVNESWSINIILWGNGLYF